MSPGSARRLWALLAAVGFAALGLASANRPWKHLQLAYVDLLEERLGARLGELRQAAEKDLAFYQGELRVARDAVDGRRSEVEELERQAFDLERRLEDARRGLRRAEDPEEIRERRAEVEGLEEQLEARRGRLETVHRDVKAAEAALQEVRAPIHELERRLEHLRRDRLWRALPGIRLWAPNVRVRSTPERCVTCHLGMDPDLGTDVSLGGRKVFEPHPESGLYGIGSAHGDLACSRCHGGDGRSTDFRRAGHLPDPAGDDPILTGELAQSSCESCHSNDEPALASSGSTEPVAPVSRVGRRLVERLGCRSCHALGRSVSTDSWAKAGPSLESVAEKLTPAWTANFLADPASWTVAMPDLWHGVDGDQKAVEIRAVVAYLWQQSRPPDGWSAGALIEASEDRAERGEALFFELGCSACHAVGRHRPEPGPARGPDLDRAGEKLAAPWLSSWLKDPAAWRANTPMPDFRLADDEAGDLVAFLVAGGEPSEEDLPEAAVDLRDRLALEILEKQTTLEQARSRLDGMDNTERTLFLGRETIRRLGCHGCHRVPGFEGVPAPVGGDLSRVGEKLRKVVARAPSPESVDPLADHPGRFHLDDAARRALLVQMLSWRGDGSGPPPDPGLETMRRRGCFACHRADGDAWVDAPTLHGIGAKLRAPYLHDYLRDPGSREPVRPWLGRRMPTFGLSPAELDTLTRFFVDRASAPLFDPPPEESSDEEIRRQRVVGRAAFEALFCARCHWDGEESSLPSVAPAPDYPRVADRLRPSWLESWILDPASLGGGGLMPELLPRGGVHDTSGLRAALDAPMFELQRIRIGGVFESEEEQEAYLQDGRAVARSLRRYLQDP